MGKWKKRIVFDLSPQSGDTLLFFKINKTLSPQIDHQTPPRPRQGRFFTFPSKQ